MSNLHISNITQKTRGPEQPDNNKNYYHHIQDSFYFGIHWNKSIYQPKDNPNNNKDDNYGKKAHGVFLFMYQLSFRFFLYIHNAFSI